MRRALSMPPRRGTHLRIAAGTGRLIVLAPYINTLRPGCGIADALSEALRAAGARGVTDVCAEAVNEQGEVSAGW